MNHADSGTLMHRTFCAACGTPMFTSGMHYPVAPALRVYEDCLSAGKVLENKKEGRHPD
jgi:hypothetical protein